MPPLLPTTISDHLTATHLDGFDDDATGGWPESLTVPKDTGPPCGSPARGRGVMKEGAPWIHGTVSRVPRLCEQNLARQANVNVTVGLPNGNLFVGSGIIDGVRCLVLG